MQSLDVANLLITRYGNEIELTNLKLNKLVYFAQAISLRKYGTPLFLQECPLNSTVIEWVVPSTHFARKHPLS
ncbi:hypothetical protein CPA40_06570 [Bifidobacterium callitrichos]|uniref:Uncharacterized protein n=1 Tax=Bifidobacterium callitrichos TaxID=762209 RepID=A0A2T3G9W1_9BIFI|nr:hypothetical protein [Bifidobacterium callitrichos]PST46242.1 hypothetical protein CPA40_06570 [Bifidobacterium callitrichos]